jgi:hypothetical protein
MIFPLHKVVGGIDKINDVPLIFLENVSHANECNEKLLPIWFRKVYRRCPGVKDKFESLFHILKKIKKKRILEIIELYKRSKDIKNICSNSQDIYPTITKLDNKVKDAISNLFSFLFEKTIGTDIFKQQSGMHIDDHYASFQEINNIFICPFCGLETYTLPQFRRAEYDHFLPISLYPWLGVNFDNLVPMGDHCNGKKNQTNILFSDKAATIRRQVWYPYEWIYYKIEILCIQRPSINNIKGKWDFRIIAINSSEQQKVDTWNSVFEISTRFSEHMSIFHKKFIEDFAHKNDLKKKRLPPNQIINELRKYQQKGIGDIRLEPAAKLRYLWADYYIKTQDIKELAPISNIIANFNDRVMP